MDAIQVAVAQGPKEEFQKKLFKILANFPSKQGAFNKTLNETVLSLKQDTVDNSNRVSSLIDDAVKQCELFNHLEIENKKLREKADTFHSDLNFQELLALQNTLEIQGVPIKDNINLSTICCDIFKVLNLTLTVNDISNVYRLQRKNAPNNPALLPISILKLSRQMLRHTIINSHKIKSDVTIV